MIHWERRLDSFPPVCVRTCQESPSSTQHPQPGPQESHLLVWLIYSITFPYYNLFETPAGKKSKCENHVCLFHKMRLSSCPPHPHLPHPTSPSWSFLKGWKKRKSWWFHSNYTIIKWWFCHRSAGKTVRKQLIRADDYLSKCIILKLNQWIKIYSVIFFPPPRVLCISQVLFFPNTFSVSPALFVPILFPLTSLLHWVGLRCVGFAQASFVLSSTCFWG